MIGYPYTNSKKEKTESLTVRLDPRLRYGLELLSRKQRRSKSELLRWIITNAIAGKYGDGV